MPHPFIAGLFDGLPPDAYGADYDVRELGQVVETLEGRTVSEIGSVRAELEEMRARLTAILDRAGGGHAH